MKISYAILTHNEGKCIERLIDTILQYKDPEDEIVVLDDYSNDRETVSILTEYNRANKIQLHFKNLDGNFSEQKNHLMNKCSGDFIFNIDADELPKPELLVNLKAILVANPEVDVYAIPRENTVEGITPEHIAKWKWRVNEQGFINFPDNQLRLIKNNVGIEWQNKVHEVPTRFRKISILPDEFALIHHKEISKQEQQNDFYDTI
jgi:glycosyltransferase involved in cell wall biosynthesis